MTKGPNRAAETPLSMHDEFSEEYQDKLVPCIIMISKVHCTVGCDWLIV